MTKAVVAERILGIVKERGSASGATIAAALGISRQAVHAHLGRLLDAGKLERKGKTRGVLYTLPAAGKGLAARSTPEYRRSFGREGLQEDAVFAELALLLGLKAGLSKPSYKVLNYAFTEMLNNAIEHSRSAACTVRAALAAREIRAVIRDHGVGVFHSIAQRMGLRDENDAIGELLKGKATTMPDRDSGEGIFFTSKACNRLALRSHRVCLRRPHGGRHRERLEADPWNGGVAERLPIGATTIRFAARDYVSRSEAKRLLARLDSFKEVVLDFQGVRTIGQAFADEIFRVFRSSHSRILLKRVNVEPALEAVIRHVIDNSETTRLTID